MKAIIEEIKGGGYSAHLSCGKFAIAAVNDDLEKIKESILFIVDTVVEGDYSNDANNLRLWTPEFELVMLKKPRKFWIWKDGRQKGANYKKMLLWQFSVGRRSWDGYLIRYQPKTVLPPHKDKVNEGKHWRLNIVLWGKGKFKVEKFIFRFKGIILFRPDLHKHVMYNGKKERMVLSFGYVRRFKNMICI